MNLFQISVQACILIAAVVILRRIFLNRLPKSAFIALWGVVLCRLLIPYGIGSRFSLYTVIRNFTAPKPTGTAAPNPAPPLSDFDFSKFFPVYTPHTSGIPVTDNPAVNIPPVPEAALTVPVWLIVWLAVAALMLFFFAALYIKSCRELKNARPLGDGKLPDEWAGEGRIFRRVRVLCSGRTKTPLAAGLLRPRIILPESMNCGDLKLMRYVVTHELEHIKHGDPFWKALLVLTLCVHWFNPLVWVMFVLANRDLELSCDERTLRRLGEENKSDYALSLISLAPRRTYFVPLHSGFSKSAAEERIKSVMKTKKLTFLSITLAILMVASVTIILATGANDNSNINKSEESDEPQESSQEQDESSSDSSEKLYNYMPVYDDINKIKIGDDYYSEFGAAYKLDDNERELLWDLMQTDKWEIADDLPVMGFHGGGITAIGNDQAWFISTYNDKTLIIPSSPKQNENKICYYAPIEVQSNIMTRFGNLFPIQILTDKYSKIFNLNKNYRLVQTQEFGDYMLIDKEDTIVYERGIKEMDWFDNGYWLLHFEEVKNSETVTVPYILYFNNDDYVLEYYDFKALLKKYDQQLIDLTLYFFECAAEKNLEKLESILTPQLYEEFYEYYVNGVFIKDFDEKWTDPMSMYIIPTTKVIDYLMKNIEFIEKIHSPLCDPDRPGDYYPYKEGHYYIRLNELASGYTHRIFRIYFKNEHQFDHDEYVISFIADGKGGFLIDACLHNPTPNLLDWQ